MSYRRLTIDDIPTNMVYVENITSKVEVLTLADDIRREMLDYSLEIDEYNMDFEELIHKFFSGYLNGTITWLYDEPEVHIRTIDLDDLTIKE